MDNFEFQAKLNKLINSYMLSNTGYLSYGEFLSKRGTYSALNEDLEEEYEIRSEIVANESDWVCSILKKAIEDLN